MDDDNEGTVFVNLCFSDFHGDVKEISERLKLPAEAMHQAGQISGSMRVPRKKSYWSAKLEETSSTDVGLAVSRSIELIQDKKDEIKSIMERTKDEGYIGVVIRIGKEKPFVNINSSILKKLGEMGLDLDIDMYF